MIGGILFELGTPEWSLIASWSLLSLKLLSVKDVFINDFG